MEVLTRFVDVEWIRGKGKRWDGMEGGFVTFEVEFVSKFAVLVILCSTLKSPELSLQLLTSPAALTYQVCLGPQTTRVLFCSLFLPLCFSSLAYH